jgi:hypothetical protein
MVSSHCPAHEESTNSHFISAFVAMALIGGALSPEFMAKSPRNHPDVRKAPNFHYFIGYSSEMAFISWFFFADYLHTMALLSLRQCGEDLETQHVLLY